MGDESKPLEPAAPAAKKAMEESKANQTRNRQLIAPGLDAERILAIVQAQEERVKQLKRMKAEKARQAEEQKKARIEREIEESKAVRTVEDPRERHRLEEQEMRKYLAQLRAERDTLSKSKHEAAQRKELTERITKLEVDFYRRTAKELRDWWSQLTVHEQKTIKNADKILRRIEQYEATAGQEEEADNIQEDSMGL